MKVGVLAEAEALADEIRASSRFIEATGLIRGGEGVVAVRDSSEHSPLRRIEPRARSRAHPLKTVSLPNRKPGQRHTGRPTQDACGLRSVTSGLHCSSD